jgi:TolB-like protein/Flp pilus assembly protein TadD
MIRFAKLRQRKIFQWSVAYLAGAWLIYEAANLVGANFDWPRLVLQLLTILLLFGLPIVVIIAWYHGEQGRQYATGAELMMIAGILVLAGSAVAFVVPGPADPAPRPSPTPQQAAEQGSLAVLPFVNMSSDPEQEYFSDGLTEELLNVLARLPELRVAARTSAFAFKGLNVPVDSIGRVLRVAHVVEGSVRKSGNRVRITAQLVDTRNGYHVWSETYDREISDIFAVQDGIAEAITQALRLRLATPSADRAASSRTPVPGAYEAYLRGRYFWNRRTGPDLRLAADHFERALELDPDYAPAHAGLANAYQLFSTYDVASPAESFPLARRAAERALELDPQLAEGHAALAQVRLFFDHDFRGAEKAFERAIELNPSYATAHQWIRLVYMAEARFDEALSASARSLKLDPLAVILHMGQGTVHYYARNFAAAIERYREAVAMDSSFIRARSELGDAYTAVGRHDDAIAEHRRAVELSNGSPRYLARLGHAYARAGQHDEARRILKDLIAAAEVRYVPPTGIATIYVGLNEHGAALDWLERAVEQRDWWVVFLAVDPALDPLRREPRFRRLVARLSLR